MMSADLYDINRPVWCLPTNKMLLNLWCLPTCLRSAYLYDVCLPVLRYVCAIEWCLPTSTVWCQPACYEVCLLVSYLSVKLYDVCWCLSTCTMSANLYTCMMCAHRYDACLYDVFRPIWWRSTFLLNCIGICLTSRCLSSWWCLSNCLCLLNCKSVQLCDAYLVWCLPTCMLLTFMSVNVCNLNAYQNEVCLLI